LAELISGRDDADLIVRLRRRDPESLGLLYDRYGQAAYTLALRSLGDPVLAESAVAEAMIKCWNRIASFKESRGSALGVWLLVITHENALDHRRAAGPKPADRCSETSAREHVSIFQDWSRSVDADRVQDAFLALRTLDANEKEVLELAFFEGSTAAEITVRTGRTPADVDKLIQSALVKVASGKQD